jgi:FAD/FMN-containing dehydrogenase
MSHATAIHAPAAARDRDGLHAFAAGLHGQAIWPEDAGYDDARAIWNGMIDRRPALIVRCADVADVIRAVRFAREHDQLVAVRGGGHNVAGTAMCDGGIVVDLSAMKEIEIDRQGRTVRAEPGLLWGEVDAATQAHGLATPGGIVTHTGIAGLTLGGGIGWLMRKHGLTSDNLVACDVVTAEGEFVRASADEHADLFWALQGGGGNFGVVTSFQYRLHAVGPEVLAGVVLYPAEEAETVLRAYRDFVAGAPEELTTIVNLRKAPPAPYLPEHLHGRPVVIIAICYAGDLAEGERVLAPLRAFGEPLIDLIGRKPYVAHQGMFDASVPHGLRYYWKSHYLAPLSDPAIDVLVQHAWEAPSPQSYTIMFHLGGAIRGRLPADSAFEDRRAEHALNINSAWSEPATDAGQIAWARRLFEAMQPFATGVYVNFLGEEDHERVRAAYGPEKYERLARIKATYDPDNFFRMNQNIRPASGSRYGTRASRGSGRSGAPGPSAKRRAPDPPLRG